MKFMDAQKLRVEALLGQSDLMRLFLETCVEKQPGSSLERTISWNATPTSAETKAESRCRDWLCWENNSTKPCRLRLA